MLRALPFAALFAVPTLLTAQEGTVAYTHSIRIDTEALEAARERVRSRAGVPPGVPRRVLPTERTREVVLFFGAAASLMKAVPSAEGAGGVPRRPGLFRPRAAAARAFRETLVEAWVRYEDGALAEARELLGRTFLIEDVRPVLEWKMTTEQAVFLDLPVLKATAVRDSTEIEAWFTPAIPVSAGPAGYGGLPGMILVLSIDGGREQYEATAVSMSPIADGVIERPTEGERVSREEYERIVQEKLEELRTLGGGGDR